MNRIAKLALISYICIAVAHSAAGTRRGEYRNLVMAGLLWKCHVYFREVFPRNDPRFFMGNRFVKKKSVMHINNIYKILFYVYNAKNEYFDFLGV